MGPEGRHKTSPIYTEFHDAGCRHKKQTRWTCAQTGQHQQACFCRHTGLRHTCCPCSESRNSQGAPRAAGRTQRGRREAREETGRHLNTLTPHSRSQVPKPCHSAHGVCSTQLPRSCPSWRLTLGGSAEHAAGPEPAGVLGASAGLQFYSLEACWGLGIPHAGSGVVRTSAQS